MAAIGHLLERAGSGGGGLLVVVGLPGSGKAVGLLDGDAGPLDLDSAARHLVGVCAVDRGR